MTIQQVKVGIDYSITCPTICIDGGTFFEFHYTKAENRFTGSWNSGIYKFFGHKYPEYKTDLERYDRISDIFINAILAYKPTTINIEAYSYGSNGKSFNLAENTGLLKYKIWKTFGIECKTFSPMTLKKVATGKGAGKKDVMYKAWGEQMSALNLYQIFNVKPTKNVGSPISDIIDSYYLTKCGV